MNIPTPSETEKAKDQWIRCKLVTTDNEKYLKRGQSLFIRDDPQRHEEVIANRNKVGAPFQYAESLFAALAAVKSMTGLPYRHLQGMLIETLGDWDTPCYTTIYRRFQALEVKRNGSVFTVTGGGTAPVRLAVDSTGLKQHNRGEWIRHKWKVRRGFVKLHVMVDVGTKKILARSPTTEPETRRCSFRCLTRPWRLRHGQVRRKIPPPGRQTQDAACTGMPFTLPEAT